MIKILRLAIVLFLTGLPFFYAQAQGGYVEEDIWSNVNPATGLESDFIITKNGDKLFGEVVRNFDYTDYDKLDFQFSGSVKTYLPADLQAFGLQNGRFFMSKRLPDSSELEFVQILFSGQLQLDFKKGKYYIDSGLDIQELRAYYQDLTLNGEKRRRHIKLYISTLKILTSGSCGFEMNDLIEKSRLEEQDFIKILTQYHECEKLPYKLHVEKIPLLKVSPTLNAGVGTQRISSYDNERERASRIDKPYYFQAEVGIRLHDFRKSPRISVDLRLGYGMQSGTWEVSQSSPAVLITGTQMFKQQLVSVPVSLNYSFLKKDDRDIYFGLKAGVLFNSMKTEEGKIDFTNVGAQETYLSEMEILNVEKTLFLPGVKLGGNFPFGLKGSFYTELHADYSKMIYMTSLPNTDNVGYNAVSVSFNVGIQF